MNQRIGYVRVSTVDLYLDFQCGALAKAISFVADKEKAGGGKTVDHTKLAQYGKVLGGDDTYKHVLVLSRFAVGERQIGLDASAPFKKNNYQR